MRHHEHFRSHVKWLLAWLGICVILALMDPTPIFVHRQAFDRAAAAWRNNPTPQNSAALREQQEKNEMVIYEARLFNTLALFVAGLLLYIVVLLTIKFLRNRQWRPSA